MGQAFRRATVRVRATSHLDAPKKESVAGRRIDLPRPADHANPDDMPRVNAENVLEEKDPQYNAMLSQMVGRIRSKPGGTPEMGNAHVVEKYNRPLPKLRNTRPGSGSLEQQPAPAGTLNAAQLRHVILLSQGKAEDHQGCMDAHQIAEKFRVDVAEIERILRYVSLPLENKKEEKE
ncbi:hypothetical protein SAY87_031445 [Trapa incisa]|uniref:Uncharacterized protein n=2 Tax=Trapa TaxID=22665 RepID=A0AAN7M367_TRANT|nr:hypothetical protein SAY87_031445 [Trapa incisa]KAK4796754.1 hypothetical protein SAY86_029080 [Trapa natans]